MDKKIDKDTALARIKVLINIYFGRVGRGEIEDNYNGEIDLIHSIDEVLDNTEIDTKRLILESLELDRTEM